MTFEQKVKTIIEGIGGVNYVFNTWDKANVDLDVSQYPVCLYITPVSGVLKLKNGKCKTTYNVFMYFADVLPYDCSAEVADGVIEKCKGYALEFISKSNASKWFEYISGDITYRCVYDTLDANITGVSIELPITELSGTCYE